MAQDGLQAYRLGLRHKRGFSVVGAGALLPELFDFVEAVGGG